MEDKTKNNGNIFDIAKSPAYEAYILLNANDPLELSNQYNAEDQQLFKAGKWDYQNKDLLINKVKTILENIDQSKLFEEEKFWVSQILWFWHHHAISAAIWMHKDKLAARKFAQQAMAYQHQIMPHPNKITKLLYLLVNDKLDEAEKWGATISQEPERSTALEIISDYKQGLIF